ncbi:hypothetical protein HDF16_005612 [Granulicella aggregans]|uniref:Uncharacterized protein n=1 Tax=Granulicella aggregans TaxID=474949 RepID=A0A7W7ZJ50_9BACT|nr:hypothetical protein [Granulicella aggregans]MBB5060876.1 hypothetical protein [Granulicella aggregans]
MNRSLFKGLRLKCWIRLKSDRFYPVCLASILQQEHLWERLHECRGILVFRQHCRVHGFPGLSAPKQPLKHLVILAFFCTIRRMAIHANEQIHVSIESLDCPFDKDMACRPPLGGAFPKRIAGLLTYIVCAGNIHNLLGCLCKTGRCKS